jgi:imidazolonepropionase-like amidohydrolase
MQQNNSILDATLHVYNSDRRGPEDLESALNTVKIAHAYGVKIGAGSDNMISEAASKNPVLNIHGELELLTRAGLSNWEALQAATIINAEIVGEQQHLGTIEKGKKANIVVLKANPLKDISNTKKIELVIKRGKLIQ